MIVQAGEINAYHPGTRTLTLRPDASLYSRFHEVAHARQHEEYDWTFDLRILTNQIPFVRHFTAYWNERDAMRRARKSMIVNQVWTFDTVNEAAAKLQAYKEALWTP